MIRVARAPVKSAPRGLVLYRAAAPGADKWISLGRDARAAREWRYGVSRAHARGRDQAGPYSRQRRLAELTEALLETVLAVASPSGDVVLWYGAVRAYDSLTPRALAVASVADVESNAFARAESARGLTPEHPCTYWDKRVRGSRRARAAEHLRALHVEHAGLPLQPILPVDAPVGGALFIGLEVAFAYLGGYQPGCLR